MSIIVILVVSIIYISYLCIKATVKEDAPSNTSNKPTNGPRIKRKPVEPSSKEQTTVCITKRKKSEGTLANKPAKAKAQEEEKSTYSLVLKVLATQPNKAMTMTEIDDLMTRTYQQHAKGSEIELLGFARLVEYIGKSPYNYNDDKQYFNDSTTYRITPKGCEIAHSGTPITETMLSNMTPGWQGYIRGYSYPDWGAKEVSPQPTDDRGEKDDTNQSEATADTSRLKTDLINVFAKKLTEATPHGTNYKKCFLEMRLRYNLTLDLQSFYIDDKDKTHPLEAAIDANSAMELFEHLLVQIRDEEWNKATLSVFADGGKKIECTWDWEWQSEQDKLDLKQQEEEIKEEQERLEQEKKTLELLTGCECEMIGNWCNTKTVYYEQCEIGRENGYIPVIVSADELTIEIIRHNTAKKASTEVEIKQKVSEHRSKLLTEPIANGETFLNNVLERTKEYSDNRWRKYTTGFPSEKCGTMGEELVVKHYSFSQPNTYVVKVPETEPWKVWAYLPFGSWNSCHEPSIHMAIAKYWYEKYGAILAAINFNSVSYVLPQPANAPKEAAMEMYAYCPELIETGWENFASLAEAIKNSTIWNFAWD